MSDDIELRVVGRLTRFVKCIFVQLLRGERDLVPVTGIADANSGSVAESMGRIVGETPLPVEEAESGTVPRGMPAPAWVLRPRTPGIYRFLASMFVLH